jgi:hypothetical protein
MTRNAIEAAKWAATATLTFALGGMTLGCSKTEEKVAKPAASAPATAPAKPRAPRPAEPPKAIVLPAGVFRAELGRRLPEDVTVRGWESYKEEGREVARLSLPEGAVQFALEPAQGNNYVLTGVARVDGADAAALKVSINGTPLPAWALNGEWRMFSTPVASKLLGAGKDALTFTSNGLPASADVRVDGLTLAPIRDRVAADVGTEAAGLLIDGFYKLEKRTRWSRGKVSTWGAVLQPGSGQYLLKVSAASFKALAPLEVNAYVNGKDLGAATFDEGEHDVSWKIPAGTLTNGLNRVELRYSRTGKPSDFGQSKDKREIALRIARLEVAPEG